MSEATLPLTQQFRQQVVERQVDRMSHDQLKQFAVNLHRHLLVREEVTKQLLAHRWGIHSMQPGLEETA